MEVGMGRLSMRRAATVAAGTAMAIAVFGGGLAMVFDGGGSPAAGPASVTLTAAPSGRPEDGASAPRPVWDVDVLSGGAEHRIQVDARATDDHGRHDRTQVTDDHGGRDGRDDRSEGDDR
jgi:hypothetical protein